MSQHQEWKILPAAAALISLSVFGFSANVLPAVLLRAAKELDVSPELLSTVFSIQFAGFIFATICGGIFADRIGKKIIFLAASVFTGLGAGIMGTADNLPVIFLGAVFMGMGGGILEGMSSALLCDLFPTRRKLVLNLSQVMYCVGAVSGPFLVGLLMPEGMSCRWFFAALEVQVNGPFLIGVLMPGGVAWRWFFLALVVQALALLVMFGLSRLAVPHDDDKIDLRIAAKIITRGSFLVPCITIFLYVFSETTVIIYLNYYFKLSLNAPESWSIHSIAVFWLALTAGRVVCAFIPEHIDYRKVIAFLMLISFPIMACQSLAATWQMALVIVVFTGLALSGTWPLIVGMTAHWNPGYSGTVVGITIACGALGVVAAPLVMAPLFKWTPAPVAFSLASLPLLAGGIIVLIYKPGK